MPGPIEIVEPVVLVRELHDDEFYVMSAFEKHASHCSQCERPLLVHQEGRTLCDRGHQYAIDVTEYLYSQNGKAHSVVDREMNQSSLVKIPRDCPSVRELLLAIEEGLRIHRKESKKAPVISYDQTYPIAPRRPAQQPVSFNEIIEREPRSKRSRVIVYHSPSPRGSPSRGSLYDEDAVDRIERSYESHRIYRPNDYHR